VVFQARISGLALSRKIAARRHFAVRFLAWIAIYIWGDLASNPGIRRDRKMGDRKMTPSYWSNVFDEYLSVPDFSVYSEPLNYN
jgi:hypothetical protein